MEIEFEFINKQLIKVVAIHNNEKKEVGQIFTPSGSASNSKNAIQVCGFNEAFDLWGCSLYQTLKTKPNGIEYEYQKPENECALPYYLLDAFDKETQQKIIDLTRKHHEILSDNQDKDRRVRIQCKDIQLRFPFPGESFMDRINILDNNVCYRCYNYLCTCENKSSHLNPYDVKREQDVFIEKKNDNKNQVN